MGIAIVFENLPGRESGSPKRSSGSNLQQDGLVPPDMPVADLPQGADTWKKTAQDKHKDISAEAGEAQGKCVPSQHEEGSTGEIDKVHCNHASSSRAPSFGQHNQNFPPETLLPDFQPPDIRGRQDSSGKESLLDINDIPTIQGQSHF